MNNKSKRLEIILSENEYNKLLEYGIKEGLVKPESGYGLGPMVLLMAKVVMKNEIPLSLSSKLKQQSTSDFDLDAVKKLERLIIDLKSQITDLATKDDISAILDHRMSFEAAVERLKAILQHEPELLKHSTKELTKLFRDEEPDLRPYLEKKKNQPFTALEIALAEVKKRKTK